jgi:suppressor of tumorigenicity protein 13
MPELSAEETSALRRACGAIRDGAECPDFFKEFLKELGVTSLPKASSKASSKPAPEQPKPADDDSDFEDDPDPDVVKPESDAPVAMGPDVAPDLSEAELDSVMELKQKAQELEASGDHQGAVDVFTQVILKAPSPLVYAKRANAFVQMRKCLAAIRDCDKALEMNPDSAKAYKTRGIAHRYLGNWEQATMDLGKGLNIDYDEDAAAIQKICAEHYNKHRVHVAKKKAARELKEREEREERARKAKEEYERQKAEAASAGAAGAGGFPGGGGFPAAACPAWEAWAACPAWEAAAACRTSLPSCCRRSCLIPSSCRRCRSPR